MRTHSLAMVPGGRDRESGLTKRAQIATRDATGDKRHLLVTQKGGERELGRGSQDRRLCVQLYSSYFTRQFG